jgi:hypothetical protein
MGKQDQPKVSRKKIQAPTFVELIGAAPSGMTSCAVEDRIGTGREAAPGLESHRHSRTGSTDPGLYGPLSDAADHAARADTGGYRAGRPKERH